MSVTNSRTRSILNWYEVIEDDGVAGYEQSWNLELVLENEPCDRRNNSWHPIRTARAARLKRMANVDQTNTRYVKAVDLWTLEIFLLRHLQRHRREEIVASWRKRRQIGCCVCSNAIERALRDTTKPTKWRHRHEFEKAVGFSDLTLLKEVQERCQHGGFV